VHHFWDNGPKYDGVGRKAMQRLLGIVHMNPEVDPKTWDHSDEGIYGLGGVRPVAKFYETFGIDVRKKTIEPNMCAFVDGRAETSMHMMFHPHLREDGMGVDYTNIHFQYMDPKKKLRLELEARNRHNQEVAQGAVKREKEELPDAQSKPKGDDSAAEGDEENEEEEDNEEQADPDGAESGSDEEEAN
jgi:hypothetical protein